MLQYKKDVSSKKYTFMSAYTIIILVCVVSSIYYVTNIQEKKVQTPSLSTQKIPKKNNQKNLNQPLNTVHNLQIAIALTAPIDQILEY